MRIIGIDLDNTIACYDELFAEIASEMGYLDGSQKLTKKEVKERLLEIEGGDVHWQALQGKIYGKFMHKAKSFSGFFNFLWRAKYHNCNIFIVSHKTKYGHFDEEKINLREVALKWLKEHNFYDSSLCDHYIKKVFFEDTQQKKIKKIEELECNYFIDDLVEIFDHRDFPVGVKKILFTDVNEGSSAFSSKSWAEIADYIFGEASHQELLKLINENEPNLKINTIESLEGRANGRVFKIANRSKSFFLKIYPDNSRGEYSRLDREYLAIKEMHAEGMPVPEGFYQLSKFNMAIYEWIDGAAASPSYSNLLKIIEFLVNINSSKLLAESFNRNMYAAEACLSGEQIMSQIHERYEKLIAIQSKQLFSFLTNDFAPALGLMGDRARYLVGESFGCSIAGDDQLLHPADFGFHNIIVKAKSGECIFIDFEYVGWDDPVKLISDFYWNPGNCLTEELRIEWLKLASSWIQLGGNFKERLNAYLPLFGLRWVLILLNDFIPEKLKNRPYKNCSNEELLFRKEVQLKKAKVLLSNISGMGNYGSALKIS